MFYSSEKIDGGGGQDIYLYNVKIGKFPEISKSSLIYPANQTGYSVAHAACYFEYTSMSKMTEL